MTKQLRMDNQAVQLRRGMAIALWEGIRLVNETTDKSEDNLLNRTLRAIGERPDFILLEGEFMSVRIDGLLYRHEDEVFVVKEDGEVLFVVYRDMHDGILTMKAVTKFMVTEEDIKADREMLEDYVTV